MPRIWTFLASIALIHACAEVRRSDAGTDAPRTTDAPAAVDAAATTDAPGPANVIVINEVNPEAPDWVELINAGATPLLLDGLSLVDGDDTHTPVPLPPSTVLPPGARFLVAFDTLCTAAPPDGLGLPAGSCVETTFGIGGSGDTIRVVRGSTVTDPVEAEATFPGGLGAGETYCRLPDGIGAFGPCMPTLNATNTGL